MLNITRFSLLALMTTVSLNILAILVEDIIKNMDTICVLLISCVFLGQRLIHISLASFLWDLDKQCRSRSDAAKRGV